MIGLIGSGNMARALARGWGEPVLASDGGSGRAQALVAELGGEALSNAEVAERADLVLLAHKPYQLDQVAQVVAGKAKAVVSVLGSSTLAELRTAYPDTPVARVMPNTPTEVRAGVTCVAAEGDLDVTELFGRVGEVVVLPERLLGAGSAMMGVAPAYWALFLEAQVDSGVRFGLTPDVAAQLAISAMAGTAALIQARGNDTLEVRREVASPGGSTIRGVMALERGGVRAAIDAAAEAVLRG